MTLFHELFVDNGACRDGRWGIHFLFNTNLKINTCTTRSVGGDIFIHMVILVIRKIYLFNCILLSGRKKEWTLFFTDSPARHFGRQQHCRRAMVLQDKYAFNIPTLHNKDIFTSNSQVKSTHFVALQLFIVFCNRFFCPLPSFLSTFSGLT